MINLKGWNLTVVCIAVAHHLKQTPGKAIPPGLLVRQVNCHTVGNYVGANRGIIKAR